MDRRLLREVSVADLFEQFIEASTMRDVLSTHHRILSYANLGPCGFHVFYPKYKRAVMGDRVRKNWKAKALFSKIDKKSSHRCYSNTKIATPLETRTCDINGADLDQDHEENSSLSSQSTTRHYSSNNALHNYNCLIIGAGPAGLRTAIELQFLGAGKVVVVEKRSRFSRNNVLHLWPFVIDDLKSLGAKKFYGKFCAGSIDHISIRQLQLILLKVMLMIGCEFCDSCSYQSLCYVSIEKTSQIIEGNNCDTNKTFCSCSLNQQETRNENDLQVENDSTQPQYVKSTNQLQENIDETKDQPTTTSDQETSNQLISESIKNSDMENESKLEKNCSLVSNISSTTNLEQYQLRGDNRRGAKAHFECESKIKENELQSLEWDVIIGADGRRNTLSKFFPRKEFRGRLAIAITANFINRQTPVEAAVPEISGLSFIYNQDMFNSLAYDTNIALENICYYKDDTHYFVMTAKKKSLLERGVLINDYAATQDLLSDSNVNREALLKYAKDAAYWTTGLDPLDFALNHYGQEDCAMFDFTSMYAASHACKAIRTTGGGFTLVGLVGDSLLEPFWPTGSGCARGFLSSFDAAWMCRQWAVNRCPVIDYHNTGSSRLSGRKERSLIEESRTKVERATYNKMALSVMAERESIYRILTQTTSENLQQNYSRWTLNPHSRYPNLNRHLVLPYQVEHLITDNENKVKVQDTTRQPTSRLDQRHRRVKSPREKDARKSSKKLKSATASPLMSQRNFKNRSKSLSKPLLNKLDYQDTSDPDFDAAHIELERSYRNLAEFDHNGQSYYLNHRQKSSQSIYGDLLVPSISGTLPSSNNLMSLEAKRARDIDECLKQRRQKSKIHVVRDQLIDQLRGHSVGRDTNNGDLFKSSAGNVALFNELRRLREQRSKDRSESRSREMTGPLSLLNSMRRCASFAERVKSFEGKSSPSDQTVPTTPKTAPIDNVRNLPQFAFLQDFVNGNKDACENDLKKTRIPVTKLTKDDWNVKCWERRLALHKQKSESENFRGSSKSLNKSISFDKPKKQVEVFKDRIKEMANKLEVVESTKNQLDSTKKLLNTSSKFNKRSSVDLVAPERPQSGWVRHLKNELIKEAEANKFGAKTTLMTKGMNPTVPSKPIKKLFEDDDDDGQDNQHYDHLCVTKNINKSVWHKGYTSHLARSKFDSPNCRVINRPKPKLAEVHNRNQHETSRSTSPSSTLSNYSTATGQSSTDSGNKTSANIQHGTKIMNIMECARCKDLVNSADKITVANYVLHRKCLRCQSCGITLRSNEIELHLRARKQTTGANTVEDSRVHFACAICEPSVRKSLNSIQMNEYPSQEGKTSEDSNDDSATASYLRGIRSRKDFLESRIDYDELYKNILAPSCDDFTKPKEVKDIDTKISTSQLSGKLGRNNPSRAAIEVSSSPVREDRNGGRLSSSACYRVETETGEDGVERATLMLPSNINDLPSVEEPRGANAGDNHKDDDEEENDDSEDSNASSIEADLQGHDDQDKVQSDESSSLNSPPETDDYEDEDGEDDDDDDDEVDGNENSTYGFVTSEEFDATSDKENDKSDIFGGADKVNDETDHTVLAEAYKASV